MHKVTRHGTALIRHWHILKLTHQGSTEPGAESDIQTRRQYVLLLFLIYSFLTIASDQLSQSTGPIFTKFSGLIQLWLQINDLKFFDPSRDVAMQPIFVGYDCRRLVEQPGGLLLSFALTLGIEDR